MSVQLYSASQPGPEWTDATLPRTTVGGNKPLHRFIKGQPKILGIVILILGTAFIMISIALWGDNLHLSLYIILPPGFLQGSLFIVCGILYILTEHNPTKKTVTTSLALSVVTALAALWSLLLILADLGYSHSAHSYHLEYNSTEYEETSHYASMGMVLGIILAFYTAAGVIIVIVMSTLATAALRSTKSQAVVVMTTDPTSPPTQ